MANRFNFWVHLKLYHRYMIYVWIIIYTLIFQQYRSWTYLQHFPWQSQAHRLTLTLEGERSRNGPAEHRERWHQSFSSSPWFHRGGIYRETVANCAHAHRLSHDLQGWSSPGLDTKSAALRPDLQWTPPGIAGNPTPWYQSATHTLRIPQGCICYMLNGKVYAVWMCVFKTSSKSEKHKSNQIQQQKYS